MGEGKSIDEILNPAPTRASHQQPRDDIPSLRPVTPRSPFGGTIEGTGGGSAIKVSPDQIEALGKKLVDAVGSELTAARRHLNDKPRNVAASSFTTFGAHLAHIYVQATEYADTDLITKGKQLEEVKDGLKKTADVWRRSEEANRVKRN